MLKLIQGGKVEDDGNAVGGWGVVRDICNQCGHRQISVVPVTVDLTTLECSKCGECDSVAFWIGEDYGST
jgi:dissimilatory sulfite reductase (desulfoviridin) alpha/beta subunit